MKFDTIKLSLEDLAKIRNEWLNKHKNILTSPYDYFFYDTEFPIVVNKNIFDNFNH